MTAFIIAIFFELLLPVILLIVLGVKRKIRGTPLLLGFVSFFLTQIVLRLPLLNLVAATDGYRSFAVAQPFLLALLLALSAGIFEESGRLAGALFYRKQLSFQNVLSFGLGHGLCEVILLVGFTQINNLMLSVFINSGLSGAAVLPADQMATIQAQLMAVTPPEVYAGIVERFSAVFFHLFATTLVFYGMAKKNLLYYLAAIGAHAIFNLTSYIMQLGVNYWILEGVLLILGTAGLVFVYKVKDKFPHKPAPVQKIPKVR